MLKSKVITGAVFALSISSFVAIAADRNVAANKPIVYCSGSHNTTNTCAAAVAVPSTVPWEACTMNPFGTGTGTGFTVDLGQSYAISGLSGFFPSNSYGLGRAQVVMYPVNFTVQSSPDLKNWTVLYNAQVTPSLPGATGAYNFYIGFGACDQAPGSGPGICPTGRYVELIVSPVTGDPIQLDVQGFAVYGH